MAHGVQVKHLGKAGPEVQKLATATLKQSYKEYAGVTTTAAGLDITGNFNSHTEFLASTLAKVPGGYNVLYAVAKERHPNDPLPYDKIFLGADPERFGPELKKAIAPIVTQLGRDGLDTTGDDPRRAETRLPVSGRRG